MKEIRFISKVGYQLDTNEFGHAIKVIHTDNSVFFYILNK